MRQMEWGWDKIEFLFLKKHLRGQWPVNPVSSQSTMALENRNGKGVSISWQISSA